MDRFQFTALIAVLATISTGACGSENADASAAVATPAPVAQAEGAEAAVVETQTAAARDRPVMTESDTIRLQMAEAACRQNDFKGFFKAFTGSWAVRERYTADQVSFGQTGQSRRLSRQTYADEDRYPVATMDYFYVTSESAAQFDRNGGDPKSLRYVQIEINQAGDGRNRVDWLPGIFEKDLTPPPRDLGDGLGDLVQETGSGGYLLFRPTATCWELVDDIRNPPLEL